MVGRFPKRRGIVMTTFACPANGAVIHLHRRRPRRDRVAVFTAIGRAHMIGRLAGGRCPVVTIHASSGHPAMIKCGRLPAGRRMTFITIIGTGDMSCRFSGGRGPVVTTNAGPVHRAMVHPGRRDPDGG